MLGATLGGTVAHAAPQGFRLDPAEPLPAQDIHVLGVARTDLVPHLALSSGVTLHYAHNLLVASTATGTVRVVGTALKAEVWVALGLFEIVDLGVVAPFVLSQTGEPGAGVDARGAGVGDVRVVGRARLLRPAGPTGFGVAALLQVALPAGDRARFHGDGEASAELRLNADWRHRLGFALAADLGVAIRPERRFDDDVISGPAFRYGLSAQAPLGLGDLVALFLAAQGSVALRASSGRRRMDPIELIGGFRFAYGGFSATLGAGGGLTEAVGAPTYRIVAGVGYRFDLRGTEPDAESAPGGETT